MRSLNDKKIDFLTKKIGYAEGSRKAFLIMERNDLIQAEIMGLPIPIETRDSLDIDIAIMSELEEDRPTGNTLFNY
tara:strand:- start:729 stop:956 length:228 start_codon:yes stop_codon:yes gene_type:complete